MRQKKGVQLQTADPNSSQENAIIYNCGQLKFCLNDSLEYAGLHAIKNLFDSKNSLHNFQSEIRR